MKRFEYRENLGGNTVGDLRESLKDMADILLNCETELDCCPDEYETDMSMFDLAAARMAMLEVHKTFTDAYNAMVKKLPELLAQHPLPVMQALGESIRVGHFGPMFNPEVIHVNGGGHAMKFDFEAWSRRWKENSDRDTINDQAGQSYKYTVAQECHSERQLLFWDLVIDLASLASEQNPDVAAERLFALVNAARLALGMPLLQDSDKVLATAPPPVLTAAARHGFCAMCGKDSCECPQ